MTLVVARIHDNTSISIVSDTLVTWDDGKVRAPEDVSLAKLVILRRDLAVGVTGHDPHGRLRDLAALRDESVDTVLEQLSDDLDAGFVVAALWPPRLWEVRGGAVYQRSERQTAWDGDPAAHRIFSARFEKDWLTTSAAGDMSFRMMTAMQALTSFPRVESVGGITIRVVTRRNGFQFAPDWGMSIGRSAWCVLVGQDPTPGALGILATSSGLGQLFRHEAPGDPITIRTTRPDTFVAVARECGQSLVYVAPPDLTGSVSAS